MLSGGFDGFNQLQVLHLFGRLSAGLPCHPVSLAVCSGVSDGYIGASGEADAWKSKKFCVLHRDHVTYHFTGGIF